MSGQLSKRSVIPRHAGDETDGNHVTAHASSALPSKHQDSQDKSIGVCVFHCCTFGVGVDTDVYWPHVQAYQQHWNGSERSMHPFIGIF